MISRYNYPGTHYSKSKGIFASDSNTDKIVIYIHQDKIFDGICDKTEVYNAILNWLNGNSVDAGDKYAIVDWCNSFGDTVFTESEIEDDFPTDDDIAEAVSDIIYDLHSKQETDFYIDGNEFINMEVFDKNNEI